MNKLTNEEIVEKKNEINENNALIAKFMGYEYFPYMPDNNSINAGWRKPAKGAYKLEDYYLSRTTKDLAYHKDWNWIMKVVKKICEIHNGKFNISISSIGMWTCFINRDDISENEISSYGGFNPIIINVWKSVVDFIKLYNKNLK